MIAMKLDAGREPDREDLHQLLAEGQVETAAEARRLYSMCYGTREMPAESRHYLIQRYTQNVKPPAPGPAARPQSHGKGTRGSGYKR